MNKDLSVKNKSLNYLEENKVEYLYISKLEKNFIIIVPPKKHKT